MARDAAAADERDDSPQFLADVVAGLSSPQKTLSPKYLYDARGSALFEEICRTPEYYPTRTETALLREIAADLSALIPKGAALIEFGSGASDKTAIVLDAAPQISTYVPIEISHDALDQAVARLAQRYPSLDFVPIAGDFTGELRLPESVRAKSAVGFFPGSTIGNLDPAEMQQFLLRTRVLLGEDSVLLVGADMLKDVPTLLAAYDDAAGVTAGFNRNLLERINRELGADFDIQAFRHEARWNAGLQRMEMHLVSLHDQHVTLGGMRFSFSQGESLHTENSHKFSTDSFDALAARSGWQIVQQWISPAPQFAMFALVPA
ncbi:L-histidine N(alpha)-methyltransferase [Duganella alba]|uniref:L-histidine N(alpha)-methyltransferase n=1 Tax=Duganella alba TaxID=2666081 RepID=UPI0035312126